MAMNAVRAAAPDVGVGIVVSFGSGNEGGRLSAAARGRGGTRSASAARVRAARNAINRSDASRARKRRALQEIDDNTSRRGNIRTGILADILADLRG